MSNAANTKAAIGRVIKELEHIEKALQDGNDKAIMKMLSKAQAKRNGLVERKLKRKELPI
jgi:prephenate dehydrogenase